MAENKTTKLQIPVTRKVAEEVSYFAKKWDRTQSEMGSIILDVAVAEHGDIGFKIIKRIFSPITCRTRPSKRGKTTKDISELVRLQVVVDHSVESKLKEMGQQIQLSGVKMAGVWS